MINVEVLAILGVGAALLTAIVPAILYLASLIDKQGQNLTQRIDETNKIIIELGQNLNHRIDETNKRIDEHINQQAAFREEMIERVVKLEGKIDRLEVRIDGLEARIDGLERKIDGLERKIDGLEVRIEGLEGRMGRVEGMLEGLHDSSIKERAA